MRNKYEVIKDVDTAIALLARTKFELEITSVNEHGDAFAVREDNWQEAVQAYEARCTKRNIQ